MQTKHILPNLGEGKTLLFGCIIGSHAYNTNLEGSIQDKAWVYVQSSTDFYINGHVSFIKIGHYERAYELSKFIELAKKANPLILEILFTPDSNIIFKHVIFDGLVGMRKSFLTKECKNSYLAIALSNLEKVKQTYNKIAWSEKHHENKTILDFCKIIRTGYGYGYEVTELKRVYNKDQIDKMAAIEVPNIPNTYNIFYETTRDLGGLVIDENTATCLKTSRVDKYTNCTGLLYLNIKGFEEYIKNKQEYEEWKNKAFDPKVKDEDAKAMVHCARLIDTALDIAEFDILIVPRNNANFLKSIRKGKVQLDTFLTHIDRSINYLEDAFESCNLPQKFIHEGRLRMIHTNIRNCINHEKEKSARTIY